MRLEFALVLNYPLRLADKLPNRAALRENGALYWCTPNCSRVSSSIACSRWNLETPPKGRIRLWHVPNAAAVPLACSKSNAWVARARCAHIIRVLHPIPPTHTLAILSKRSEPKLGSFQSLFTLLFELSGPWSNGGKWSAHRACSIGRRSFFWPRRS